MPVGSRSQDGIERPRAVSEYLVDRMLLCGADKLCFVISPGKSDILRYYGSEVGSATVAYVVQSRPPVCATRSSAPRRWSIRPSVLIGLPDVWFPEDGLALDADRLSFLLFPVDRPELFDAVATDAGGRVREIWVKSPRAGSAWVWGPCACRGRCCTTSTAWRAREAARRVPGHAGERLVGGGGVASGIRAGTAYVDVGTLNGYRAATELLQAHADGGPAPDRDGLALAAR